MMEPNSKEEMLKQFVSGLVQEKQAPDVDEEALVLMLSDEIDSALIEALPDESLDKLLDAVENSESEVTLESVIAESGIDQGGIVENVLREFRDAFMASSEEDEAGVAVGEVIGVTSEVAGVNMRGGDR